MKMIREDNKTDIFMKYSTQIIQSWQDNAAAWTTAVREDKIASRKLVTNQAILETMQQLSPRKVLDAGCGEGWLCRALAALGKEMTGTDVSFELIEQAQKEGGAHYLNLDYEAFCGNPKACGSEFDAVVFNFSLLEEDLVPVLKAAHSILAPGGRIVIQTVHPFSACGDAPYENSWRIEHFSAFGTLFPSPMPWYFRTLSSWMETLKKAGLNLNDLREPLHPETGQAASLILVTG